MPIQYEGTTLLYTTREVADSYGVKPGTIRMWVKRGKIFPAVKEGNVWFFGEEQLGNRKE